MLWMVGYLMSGIAAVIITVIYLMVILPYVCSYELEE